MGVNKMFLNLIFKSITIRINKTLIILLSIIVGASIVFSFSSIYFDINTKMSKELRTFGANFFIGNIDKNKNISLNDYNSALSYIKRSKLVGASPLIYGMVRLDLGNAVLTGIDFKEAKHINPFWQVEGSWINVSFDEKNCMVGKTLAKNMELKIGSTVMVKNTKTNFLKKLVVKGIIDSGSTEDNQIFVNFKFASRILGSKDSFNHAMLSILYTADEMDELANSINENIPSLIAKPIRKVSHSEGKILNKIKGLMAIIAFMILLITTLCVNTTLISSIEERSKEIALQKAIGARNSSIVNQFLIENAIVTIIGIIVGCIVGYFLAQIMGKAIFGSSIDIRSQVIPITFVISFFASIFAALFPIKKVLQILPANVLRGE